MKDVTISMFEYHVVASVPDLQTKPADSRPTRFKNMVVAKDE
jgi:hypothetical protein